MSALDRFVLDHRTQKNEKKKNKQIWKVIWPLQDEEEEHRQDEEGEHLQDGEGEHLLVEEEEHLLVEEEDPLQAEEEQLLLRTPGDLQVLWSLRELFPVLHLGIFLGGFGIVEVMEVQIYLESSTFRLLQVQVLAQAQAQKLLSEELPWAQALRVELV